MIITKAGNKYVITDASGNFYASTYSAYDAHLISQIPAFLQLLSEIKTDRVEDTVSKGWSERRLAHINWLAEQLQKEIDSPSHV